MLPPSRPSTWHNLMKGKLPPELGNLKKLVTLSLDGNDFNLAPDVHITDVKRIQKDLRKEWQIRERAATKAKREAEEQAKNELIKTRQGKRQNQQERERAEVEAEKARKAAADAVEAAWEDEDDDEW